MDMDVSNSPTEEKSQTATAIMNILQNISISPPQASQTPIPFSNNSGTSTSRSSLQYHHSLPKSIIPKRRLSSSSSLSFDGFMEKPKNHTKKQLVYLRHTNGQMRTLNLPSPLSRKSLMQRLNTFSVLNWTIQTPLLSPLTCAAQGWKCHPVRKNELHCTGCHSGIMVKLSEEPIYEPEISKMLNSTEKYEHPFDFQFLDDEYDDDDTHIFETLVNSYVSRLTTDHYPTCTFFPILPLTPMDQNYYITAKDIPRELNSFATRLEVMKLNKNRLIGKNFKRQILSKDEVPFLLEYLKENSQNDIDIDDGMSNFNGVDLSINPSLDVILPALLGWDLKIQKFHNERFLLLKCECCTRRILLTTTGIENTNNIEELASCPYKAKIPAPEEMTEFDETVKTLDLEYDDDMIDLEQEHDSWCCMKSGWRVLLEGLRSTSDTKITSHLMNKSPSYNCELFKDTMGRLKDL